MENTQTMMQMLALEKVNILADTVRKKLDYPGLSWESTLRPQNRLMSATIGESIAEAYVSAIDTVYPNTKAKQICYRAASSTEKGKFRIVIELDKLMELIKQEQLAVENSKVQHNEQKHSPILNYARAQSLFPPEKAEKINLSKEVVKNILKVFSAGLSDWSERNLQVVSPLYSSSDAAQKFSSIKGKLESIGIKVENSIIFLADSQTEKGKQRVVVDVGKFNNGLDNGKLNKLKDTISEISESYSKTIESGEVGQGRGTYILESYISECTKVLEQLCLDQTSNTNPIV